MNILLFSYSCCNKIEMSKKCHCSHQLNLLNIKENELVNHQFLLIKGFIQPNTKCCNPVELNCKDLLTNNILKPNRESHLNDGQFKFLIDLGLTNKSIKLNFIYCSNSLSMTIHYNVTPNQYRICPLLILANDEIVNDTSQLYCKIIDVNLRLLQCVYADKLRESVQKRQTFQLIEQCNVFYTNLSKSEIWDSEPDTLWETIARELIQSDWSKNERLKFIAIINCTKYNGDQIKDNINVPYENIKKLIKGNAALGAGGLALFGSVYFYCWPSDFRHILLCFENSRKVDIRKHADESNYRKTWGAVYASTLGAMCHELGHIFDLGHTRMGIMGSGFDLINRVFTLNSLTEHLPERLIKQEDKTKAKCVTNLPGRQNFTQLRKPANGFLDSFRTQKGSNDGFYFMRNSAVTLALHPWFSIVPLNNFHNDAFIITLDIERNSIEAKNVPLKLIEIRCDIDSLTEEFYEFQTFETESALYKFEFPKSLKAFKGKYHLFILSIEGHIQRIKL